MQTNKTVCNLKPIHTYRAFISQYNRPKNRITTFAKNLIMKKTNKKLLLVNLGCSKNLVDSEVVMQQAKLSGIDVLYGENPETVDAVLINTCGFIADAKEESIETIVNFAEAKEEGLVKHIYVMGCLSQRYRDELKKEIPEVDQFFGVDEFEDVVKSLGGNFRKEKLHERFLTTPSHYAYLKIAEGCDRKCSFCAIPMIRGKHLSRSIEDIMQEAEYLAKQGVKEVILISQDLTYYGIDIYKKQMLTELTKRLSDSGLFEWIRLHYTYPTAFPLDLLALMRERENICNYIDIPLQHISTPILKSMKRGIDRQGTLDLMEAFRKNIPDAAVRTTFIVGYPGESEEDFEALLEFIRTSRFERVGAFTYSEEEDTAAAKLADDVPEEVKQLRLEQLMDVQQGISLELNKAKEGKVFRCIIDRIEDDFYVGRTEFDSPEVDNEVLVPSEKHQLQIGEFYPIRIMQADFFDLYGELAE